MLTEQLFDFLAASPSCYHAVQALAERLERNGYAQLREQDAWALTPGGKYFRSEERRVGKECRL